MYNEKETEIIIKELGSRIKKARELKKWYQEDLAERVGLSRNTILNYEKGSRKIRIDDLIKIANALQVSIEYLTGEKGAHDPAKAERMVELPLLSMAAVASCGAGNGLYGVDMSNTESISIAQSTFSNYSEVQKPFAIKTEGDSMEGAGVLEGSIAIINPAEEVRSGEIALVCVDDSWLIKWVVYKPNGDIELCPANPNYQTIIVDKEYATDPSWFRIIGKVVKTITENKLRNAF